MASLDSILIAFITGCFGMASGIFFVLYCLEQPIYSVVLRNKTYGVDSDLQMRRVLLVLQQFLKFRVPVVMGSLIISATVSSTVHLRLYGFNPLSVLIIFCGAFVILSAVVFVKPAIKIFENVNPEASSGEIQAALAPIVGLHRNIGMFVAFVLILQLSRVAF